eukprot:scaffold546_cov115-Cylindrotheca_fusiformis.AAC.3
MKLYRRLTTSKKASKKKKKSQAAGVVFEKRSEESAVSNQASHVNKTSHFVNESCMTDTTSVSSQDIVATAAVSEIRSARSPIQEDYDIGCDRIVSAKRDKDFMSSSCDEVLARDNKIWNPNDTSSRNDTIPSPKGIPVKDVKVPNPTKITVKNSTSKEVLVKDGQISSCKEALVKLSFEEVHEPAPEKANRAKESSMDESLLKGMHVPKSQENGNIFRFLRRGSARQGQNKKSKDLLGTTIDTTASAVFSSDNAAGSFKEKMKACRSGPVEIAHVNISKLIREKHTPVKARSSPSEYRPLNINRMRPSPMSLSKRNEEQFQKYVRRQATARNTRGKQVARNTRGKQATEPL